MKIAFIGAGGIAGNYRGSLKRLNQPISEKRLKIEALTLNF